MLKRKIMASILAVSTMLSATATVHAEDTTEARETVRIGQYDCWVENGEYYTELDGEVGLVIDVDTFLAKPDSEVTTLSSEITWDYLEANAIIDIRDGREYQGVITLNKYDDYTPIFLIETGDNGFASVKLSTKFSTYNRYKLTINLYNKVVGKWNYPIDRKATFGPGMNFILLVSGTETTNISKCCVYFHKDESTGQSVFNYWIQGLEE